MANFQTAVEIWLDVSESTTLVGCGQCPGFRLVCKSLQEAKEEGRSHSRTLVHVQHFAKFVYMD